MIRLSLNPLVSALVLAFLILLIMSALHLSFSVEDLDCSILDVRLIYFFVEILLNFFFFGGHNLDAFFLKSSQVAALVFSCRR